MENISTDVRVNGLWKTIKEVRQNAGGGGGEGQPEMDWHSIQEGVEVFPCHFILWKLKVATHLVILCADRE